MIAKGMAPAAPEVMLRVSGSFVIGDMRDRHRDMERLRETDTWRETEAEMEAEKPRHSYRREAGEETQRRSAESDEQGAGVWRRHGKMQRRGGGGGERERGSGPPLTRTGAFAWITKGPPSWGPVTPSAGSFRAVHSLPRSPEQPEPSLSRSLRQPARARRRVGADNRPWHKRTELGMTEPGRAPQGEQEREGDRQAAGLRQGVWAPAVSGPHRPPLGTAWIYCHPGRVPLTFWEREPGGQPRREAAPPQDASGPRRESVAAKSHPKLLAAQTCSWGGARSLGGSGVGVGGRLPPVQFRKPETGGSWLRVPQNRSQGKGIPGRGNSLCKGLWVSERAGQEVLGHHGSET